MDECIQWIDVTFRNYKTRGYGMFAVEGDQFDGVIGFCGLVHPKGQRLPEIKYALDRSLWGNGLGTELAQGLLDYATKVIDLHHIIATIATQNEASIRIVEQIGMTRSTPRIDDDGSVIEVYEFVKENHTT